MEKDQLLPRQIAKIKHIIKQMNKRQRPLVQALNEIQTVKRQETQYRNIQKRKLSTSPKNSPRFQTSKKIKVLQNLMFDSNFQSQNNSILSNFSRNGQKQATTPLRVNPKLRLEKLQQSRGLSEDQKCIINLEIPKLNLKAIEKQPVDDDVPVVPTESSPVNDYISSAPFKQKRRTGHMLTETSTPDVRVTTQGIRSKMQQEPSKLRVYQGNIEYGSPRFKEISPRKSPRGDSDYNRSPRFITPINSSRTSNRGAYKQIVQDLYSVERTNFFICHNKPHQSDHGHAFHFHEYVGPRPIESMCGSHHCQSGQPGIFSPLELAMEAARCKLNNNFDRFNRIRPVLINYRETIEDEMRWKDKGMKPDPKEVMENLLKKMDQSGNNKSEQTKFKQIIRSGHTQTVQKQVVDQMSSPVNSQVINVGTYVYTPIEELISSIQKQPRSKVLICDWKRVPVHKMVIENMTDFQAIRSCYAEVEREKFTYFGRLNNPKYSPEEALNHVLKSQTNDSEIDYIVSLIKRQDQEESNKIEFFNQANLTYMTLMMLIGQAKTYDYVINQYKSQLSERFDETLIKLFTRCQVTFQVLDSCRQIFKSYRIHKTTVRKLLEQQNADPQQLADYFSRQACKLYKLINIFLKECSRHTNLGHNLNAFTYDGVDLRNTVREDIEKVQLALGNKIKVMMLDEQGGLIQ